MAILAANCSGDIGKRWLATLRTHCAARTG